MARKKQPIPVMLPPKKLVTIQWLDAYYDDEVHTEEQLRVEDKTCTIYSTGFLADNSHPDVVTIGMDWCPNGGHYRHVCRIRRENIKNIFEITGEDNDKS